MDIERTMPFIPEIQARLEESSQKHNEQIAENAWQIQANSRQIQEHFGMIRQLLVDVILPFSNRSLPPCLPPTESPSHASLEPFKSQSPKRTTF